MPRNVPDPRHACLRGNRLQGSKVRAEGTKHPTAGDMRLASRSLQARVIAPEAAMCITS